MSSPINKNEIFPSNGENINDFLPKDCLGHIFKSLSHSFEALRSFEVLRPLSCVCKAWQLFLETSYSAIATGYRINANIAPFYHHVTNAKGEVDSRKTGEQTYLPIMRFADAPHIQKALQQELGLDAPHIQKALQQELDLQIVTPLTPPPSLILDVARDANLVEFFERVFTTLMPSHPMEIRDSNQKFLRHCGNTFSNACTAASVPPSAFEVGRLDDIPTEDVALTEDVSLVDKALCIKLFVEGLIKDCPELLGQETLSFNFSNKRASALPLEVCLIRNLTSLTLCNNELSSLPEAFGQLSKLEILHLSGNKFNIFPKIICSLNTLKRLELQGNELSDLPETISLLSTLEDIDLSRNQLTHLPEGIFNLPNLVFLNIKENKIDTITLSVISERLSKLPRFKTKRFAYTHLLSTKKDKERFRMEFPHEIEDEGFVEQVIIDGLDEEESIDEEKSVCCSVQ
jgi:hypothetical protein